MFINKNRKIITTMPTQREDRQQPYKGEKASAAAASLDDEKETIQETEKMAEQKTEQQENSGPSKESPYSIEELKDLLQRTQANFENYRKQTEKRVEEMQELAGKQLIVELLPIVDNFELALQHAEGDRQFVKGIKLIYAQLLGFLENAGVQIIDARQQLFDPKMHEALLKVESELPEHTVLEELQKGYTLHGRVLRPARVKISAGPKKSAEKKDD